MSVLEQALVEAVHLQARPPPPPPARQRLERPHSMPAAVRPRVRHSHSAA